jgi:hypothetical protein
MNKWHGWWCKPGVAEGMLIAIMVVGSRRATQWCCKPVLELGPKLRDGNSGDAVVLDRCDPD